MKYTIFFIVTLLCFGCSNKEKDDAMIKEINCNLDHYEDIDFHTLIDSVEYIKLETNSNSLINNITKIVFYDNRFYILTNSQNSIFEFDRYGKYINKLERQGGGPEEYVMISDFTINKNNGALTILDSSQNKLLVYDLKSLTFDHSISLSIFARNIIALNNDNGYLTFNTNKGVCKIANNTSVQEYINDEGLDIPTQDIGYLYWLDEVTGFFSPSENRIYHYKNQQLEPVYKISYNKSTPADIEKTSRKSSQLGDIPPYEYSVALHTETERWLIQLLNNYKSNTANYFLYDKKADKGFMLKNIRNYYDGLQLKYYPLSMMDGCIIYPVDNFTIMSYQEILKQQPNSKISTGFRNIIMTAKKEENPILQIIHLTQK